MYILIPSLVLIKSRHSWQLQKPAEQVYTYTITNSTAYKSKYMINSTTATETYRGSKQTGYNTRHHVTGLSEGSLQHINKGVVQT